MIATPLLALALAVGVTPSDDGGTSNSSAASPPATSAAATSAPPKPERVGGDVDAAVEWKDGTWHFGTMRIEAPLPEGYPQPTPPGAIEIKRYPSVRRAEFVGSGNSDMGMNFGFWPLFQHIKKRDIAMTSPVEMNYRGGTGRAAPSTEDAAGTAAGQSGAGGGASGGASGGPSGGASGPTESSPNGSPPAGGTSDRAWTMSFLYRTPDLGPTGQDGTVRVVDSEPLTVVSIGLRGPYRLASISEGVDALHAWLANHPEWEPVDDPRAFYYNGPEIRNANKWSEAQLPIRPRPTPVPVP